MNIIHPTLLFDLGLAIRETPKAPNKGQPNPPAGKPISPNLVGIFFRDINYSAEEIL